MAKIATPVIPKKRLHAFALLLRASEAELPLTVETPEDIGQLRSYAAAGLVMAKFPLDDPASVSEKATILSITKAGAQTLDSVRFEMSITRKR